MSSWPKEFKKSRDHVDYSCENKPYVGLRRQIGQTGDCIEIFMHNPEDIDVFLPQVNRIRDFCNGTTLESIYPIDERDDEGHPFVAWLDDRSHDKGARAYHGPLTTKKLRRLLGSERFRPKVEPQGQISAPSSAQTQNSSRPATSTSEQRHEPDAERRLIFVTDLDASTIRALILTASAWQTPALRDALYRHVSFETSIGVSFPSRGLSMFELAFHLPFYVWRASQTPRVDPRRDVNGDPLRHFQDVSFLDRGSQGPSHFLYEAQTSCVISGVDKWRWVAYCFADTYFDGDDEARETILDYHYDKEAEEGMNADPLTFGTHDADTPIWNPRQYFLRVLEHRLTPIKREWQRMVLMVEQKFRDYDKTEHHRLILSKRHSLAQDFEGTYRKLRSTFDWVQQVMRLCNQLREGLWKTIDAYEGFCSKHAAIFVDIPRSAIEKTFDELRTLRKTLEYLANRCDQCTKELQLDLELETTEAGNRQMQLISETNKNSSHQIRLAQETSEVAIRQVELNAQTYQAIQQQLQHVVETNRLAMESSQLANRQVELNTQTYEAIKAQLQHVAETNRLAVESAQMANRQLQLNTDTNSAIKDQLALIQRTFEDGQAQRELTERSGQEAKVFSWIMMIFVSPVALAAGIFSMQGNVIPFLRPNIGWFLGLVFAFILMQVAVHVTLIGQWKRVPAMVRKTAQYIVDGLHWS